MRPDPCSQQRLQSHTRTGKSKRQHPLCIRPARVCPTIRQATLIGRHSTERSGHRKARRHECSEREPSAGFGCAELVPYSAEEGTPEEGEEGDEGLTVGDAKFGALFGPGEETGQG